MELVEEILPLLKANLGSLVLAGVLLGVILLFWMLAALGTLRRRLRSEFGDQRALLREVGEDMADDVAQSRQQLQESLSAGLMRLQDVSDQRFNGLQRQMLQDAAGLK